MNMATSKEDDGTTISLRGRLKHFTWAWFTLTMSTGGIALLLAVQPHIFKGLITIGTVFFVFDLAAFIVLSALISTRFMMYPGTFTRTLHHSTESLFIPTWFLSLSVILSCIQEYGVPSSGPWLLVVLRVLFWIYVAVTFLMAVFQYHLLFTGKHLTINSMTPGWILPAFPIMLSGTVASAMAPSQPTHSAIPIIIAGFAFQTLGMLVSLLLYSNYFRRLMTDGLPTPSTRPGMFISVGPPAFTGLAYIGLAEAALKKFPQNYIVGTSDVPTAQVLLIMAVFFAIGLWALSLFFFCLSLVAVILVLGQTRFHLTWWSVVFPNTGFIIAMIKIGTAIDSPGILWVASVATVVQVVLYFCVLFFHARAVMKKEILWPGRDEDHEA